MELCNAHPNQRLSGDQQIEMLVDLCGVRPRWWAKVCRIKTICSLFLFVFRLRLFSPGAREKLWSSPLLVSSPLFTPLNHPSVFILKTDGSSERHLKLSFPFFFSFFSFPDPSTPRLSCFCSYLNPHVRCLQRTHTNARVSFFINQWCVKVAARLLVLAVWPSILHRSHTVGSNNTMI